MNQLLTFLTQLPLLAKFAIVMAAIVLLPRLMERFKLPGVLGYILAGVVIGPAILGILKSTSPTIQYFS
jgi:Kef-type K+ transport system membrane component KefB